MSGLDGTIKTPVGEISKKTALYAGGIATILGVYVWYRHKQLGGSSTASTDSTDSTDTEIDPATGYAYGSAEDLAALDAQGNTTSPTEGGSSTIPNVGFTSNGQWTQAVISYMTSNGLVADATALSAALGKYTTGAYVAVGSTEDSLIEQAIASEGYPPISGIGGYPPSINRTPPAGTTSGGTSTTPGAISGRVSTAHNTSISTSFKGATGAVRYQVTLDGKIWNEIPGSPFTIGGLKPSTTHSIGIRAVSADGHLGPVSTSTVRTLK